MVVRIYCPGILIPEVFPQEVRWDPLNFVTLRFFLYYPAFAVLRPRVGPAFSRIDICPVSLIPELLGMVDKA